jgi:SAM-dependent methyltransferase
VDVAYRVATAEDTGLPGGSYDLVTAGQCWHWFDGDRAAAEVRRLLRPGGSVVIAHFDWIPLPGNVASATEALIERHNPSWAMGGGSGLYPRWLTDLGRAGFEDIRTFSFDVVVDYRPEAWIGRIRASAGVGATLAPEQVERLSADLRRLLAEHHPADPLEVPHRTWAVVATAP